MDRMPDERPRHIHSVEPLLHYLRQICTHFQIASLNRPLEAAESLLVQNRPIDVAILGQFKAGKSSFLNSILGKAVLPVGAIPVTTAITRLQYGEKERVQVRHFDGSVTEVTLSDLPDYTSEAKNPNNQRNVEVVDIELPSLKPYAGLRLVDTPGLGSVFAYHKSTSENWLPEVGAALMAVSSDRPLSENDLELIRELTQYTPNILLLLTKTDLLSTEQQDEVIAFFHQTLQRELNRDFPLYLYSTQVDTEHHKQRIEREILQSLSSNRDSEFQRILRHKTKSLLRSILGYLDIALQTALQADSDREGLRAQILNEQVNEELMREELGLIARENALQTRPMLKAYLDRFYGPLVEKTTARLEKDIPSWKGNLWQLSRHFEAWTSEVMTEEMWKISRSESPHFFGTLKKSHASFSRSLAAFRRFLDENIQKVLGIRLAEVDWNIEVAEPEHPDIIATKSFDIHLDLIWFLIPMFLFRKAFERHFVRCLPREVEMNLSRLAYQWEKRINAAIDSMKEQAVGYVRDELTTIDALLSKTGGQSEEIRRITEELKEASERLES
ncbi:MAG: Isoniazid-induced protein IniA [Syntrophus sp. PtaU1.Bin005]|jgi:GTP-binding protein EngB required for normal cell division|nr:MAG: Isoniazid-induced protein IniA [Syntrophus sp. PtaB.Bin138]OPY79417.1 MAG: Isoniazid-induced protein IniA [Syntrophus sp. PtaU1.Bin005]